MKIDSGTGFSTFCTLLFNQGALELIIIFCKTNLEPLLASIQLTPPFEQFVQHVRQATHNLLRYSLDEACQSILSSVCLDLAELSNVKRMSSDTVVELTRTIAQCQSSIPQTTSAALFSCLPTRTAVRFYLISIALSVLTLCIGFTLFLRQWRRLFTHPETSSVAPRDDLCTLWKAILTPKRNLLFITFLFLKSRLHRLLHRQPYIKRFLSTRTFFFILRTPMRTPLLILTFLNILLR